MNLCARLSAARFLVVALDRPADLTGYVGGAAYATMMVVAPGTPFGTRTYKHLAP